MVDECWFGSLKIVFLDFFCYDIVGVWLIVWFFWDLFFLYVNIKKGLGEMIY